MFLYCASSSERAKQLSKAPLELVCEICGNHISKDKGVSLTNRTTRKEKIAHRSCADKNQIKNAFTLSTDYNDWYARVTW